MIAKYRNFKRSSKSIAIFLEFDEWPEDVPLPAGSTIVEVGAVRYEPVWEISLEEQRTVDRVWGLFEAPLPRQDLVKWYQAEMSRNAWEEVGRGEYDGAIGSVIFQHPETEVKVKVILEATPKGKSGAQFLVSRSAILPWPPIEENESPQTLEELQPEE